MEYIPNARDEFFDFIRHYHTADDQKHFTHLQDYLAVWVDEGSAVESTGGNFETYLKVVVHVIDAYFKEPSRLDFRGTMDADSPRPYERRVKGVLDLGRSGSLALDRHYYEVNVQRQQRRGR